MPSRSVGSPGAGVVRSLLARTEEELRAQGYSESTRRSYLGHVRRYLRAADSVDGAPGPEEVRPYLEHMLEDRGLSHAHVAQCASALKFFYRRVCPGMLDPEALPTLRKERALPVVLSRREVATLLDRMDSPRYRAILMLLYGAGLRGTEVVRLRPGDLDSQRKLLHVRPTDARPGRSVALSEVARRAVEAYRELDSSPRWLFSGASPGRHISPRAVWGAFQQARQAAGIDREVGLRSLRHSFAVHLLEDGICVDHLQELLGHAQPRTTRIYLRVARVDPATIRSPLDAIESLLGD